MFIPLASQLVISALLSGTTAAGKTELEFSYRNRILHSLSHVN